MSGIPVQSPKERLFKREYLPGRALSIVTSFCAEFQHGQHLSSREGKKEVTKGKEGKESGQSSGQSSPEGKLLQDLKYG